MATSAQNSIDRLNREIASLQGDVAKFTKKLSDLGSKHSKAMEAASLSKIASTIKSKLGEAERTLGEIAATQKKISDTNRRIAGKTKSLRTSREQDARDQEKIRKRIATEQRSLIQERGEHERLLKRDLNSRAVGVKPADLPDAPERHDFFISHASEDKEDFVRALANHLKDGGADVWYDELTLSVGDSLRRNIDKGLAGSTFGVVVLSEAFFKKEWPQRELDGLVALEVKGQTRILPIWHKVTFDQVSAHSPTLADKVALNSSTKSVADIAEALLALLPKD